MVFYCLTDKGRVRRANEDYVFASDRPIGPLPNLFLVADGMGGQNAGGFASEYCVRQVVERLRGWKEQADTPEGVEEAMHIAISSANGKVFDRARHDREKHGMGTTLVAACILPQTLIVANVGDSRLYIRKDGELSQVTQDHSYVEEMVRRGELSRQSALYHSMKNRITRAIGAELSVRIDFFREPVQGVDHILLCTDGLTNMVENREMAEVLAKEEPVRQQAEQLREMALAAGGRDNITVILIEP